VGRQPSIVRGVLRTSDAVTPMPHLAVPFATFSALYVVLAIVVVLALRRHVFSADVSADTTRDGGDVVSSEERA
jgi:cytochrome d ubiquinol oxidase subunit I